MTIQELRKGLERARQNLRQAQRDRDEEAIARAVWAIQWIQNKMMEINGVTVWIHSKTSTKLR